MQLSQPEIGERSAWLAVDVAAQFERAASAAGDDERKFVLLVGSPGTHSGSEGENRIIQQRASIGLLNRIHSLDQSCEGGNVEAVQFKKVFHMPGDGVGHGVMAVWLVQNSLPVGGRSPSFGPHHQGSDIGEPVLQGCYQKVTHEMNILIPRQMLGWTLYLCSDQLGLHFLDAIHPFLDGPDGLNVFLELPAIVEAQAFLQLTGIPEGEIGDISKPCV